MAETILFEIPSPTSSENAAYGIAWFQSDNGVLWDSNPIDTILVSDLSIDPESGLYIWSSSLASPARWSNIKTSDSTGSINETGFIIPPRPTTESSHGNSGIIANKVYSGIDTYFIGDSVDLILEVDESVAQVIGQEINVHILDPSRSILSRLVASNIGGGTYVTEYIIPKSIIQNYNILGDTVQDISVYTLSDCWIFPDNTTIEYEFKVRKKDQEQPVTDNSVMQIIINGIKSKSGTTIKNKTALAFMTKLEPFYCSISDVRDLYSEILNDIDDFTLARRIQINSRIVDLHMAPDQIDVTRKDAYDLAVRHFVRYKTAIDILSPILQVSSESKELDTLKISRSSGNPRQLLDILEKEINKYEKIIWAGGFDTPFVTRRFAKGLFDPNRLVIGRAKLEVTDRFPWVNKTTGSTLMEIDGDQVEVRGSRTIALNSNPRFDYSNLIGLENPEGLWLT